MPIDRAARTAKEDAAPAISMDRTLSLTIWFVGLVVVLAGIWVLFTETPLADFVPLGITLAVLLVLLGVGVMAASRRFRASGSLRHETYVHEPHLEPPAEPGVLRRETYVQDDDPHRRPL